MLASIKHAQSMGCDVAFVEAKGVVKLGTPRAQASARKP